MNTHFQSLFSLLLLSILSVQFLSFIPVKAQSLAAQYSELPGQPTPIKLGQAGFTPNVRPQSATITSSVGTPSLWLEGNVGATSSSWTNRSPSTGIAQVGQTISPQQPSISTPSNDFILFDKVQNGINLHQTTQYTGNRRYEQANVQTSQLVDGSNFSMFLVAKPSVSAPGTLIDHANGTGCGQHKINLSTDSLTFGVNCDSPSRLNFDIPVHSRVGQAQIVSVIGASGNVDAFIDGRPNGSKTGMNIGASVAVNLGIGGGPGQVGFEGQMGEVLVYPNALSAIQRDEIETYLAIKYGITLDAFTAPQSYLNSNGSSVYNSADNVGFNQTVYSMGTDMGYSLTTDKSTTTQNNQGRLIIDKGYRGILNDAQYGFFSQKNGGTWTETTSDVPSGVAKRLDQVWKVSTVNTPDILADMWFDLRGLGTSTDINDIALLISDTPSMANAVITQTSSALFGGPIFVPVTNFANGKYVSLMTKRAFAGYNLSVNSLDTKDRSPAITGVVNVPGVQIDVTIGGRTYIANNYSSWWQIPAGTISPPLADGVYDVQVSLTSPLGLLQDSTSNEITIDNSPPILAFEDDVEVGPVDFDAIKVVESSDSAYNFFAIGYSTDNICDGADTFSTNANYGQTITLTDYSKNGMYVCINALDSANNEAFLVSQNPLNLAINGPEITFTNDAEIGPVDTDLFELTVTDTDGVNVGYEEYIFTHIGGVEGCNPGVFNYTGRSFQENQFTVATSFHNGEYVCVKYLDNAGNFGYKSSSNPLNINESPPQIILVNLPVINLSNSSNYQVYGYCDYTRGNNITVMVGSVEQLANCYPNGTFSSFFEEMFGVLPDGDVVIMASMTSITSDEISSDAITIQKDMTAPSVPTFDSVITNDTTPTLSGSCDPDQASITVNVGSLPNNQLFFDSFEVRMLADASSSPRIVYTTTCSEGGQWSVLLDEMPDGVKNIYLNIQDIAGNDSDNYQDVLPTLTIDTEPPVITIADDVGSLPTLTETIGATIADNVEANPIIAIHTSVTSDCSTYSTTQIAQLNQTNSILTFNNGDYTGKYICFVGFDTAGNKTVVASSNPVPPNLQDRDGDGVANIVEEQAPNNGDGNNDGIQDEDQANVVSTIIDNIYTSTKIQGQSLGSCSTYNSFTQKLSREFGIFDNTNFVAGLVDFSAPCAGTMDIEINWFTELEIQDVKLVKCDINKIIDGRCELTQIPALFTKSVVDGRSVIITKYQIIDNGVGDFDPTIGMIHDPVGLVRIENNATPNQTSPVTTLIRTGGHAQFRNAIALIISTLLIYSGIIHKFRSK